MKLNAFEVNGEVRLYKVASIITYPNKAKPPRYIGTLTLEDVDDEQVGWTIGFNFNTKKWYPVKSGSSNATYANVVEACRLLNG